ncbi:MAG: dUTPase [Alkalicoccus sp.]|nr:MAG: dUTPase [Alkalicoccus sp.]
MNIEKLFHKQRQLDAYIEEKRNVTAEEVLEEKLLAFIVETGELANEVRCFKFWSGKGPSDKAVILEEYVDGLHFLLSIGNTLSERPEFDQSKKTIKEGTEKEKTAAFLVLTSLTSALYKEKNRNAYQETFEAYISLAGLLGYTWDDVLEAYESKNKENYSRQDNNY